MHDMYTTSLENIDACTYHYISSMYIASSVRKISYPICSQHHMHTTPHISHAHSTLCTQYHISNMYMEPSIPNTEFETFIQHYLYYTMYIILHNQHVHRLNIHHTACTQHHTCKKYNIYGI